MRRIAITRAWLARTFLRPRSITLLEIAAPTREQLAAMEARLAQPSFFAPGSTAMPELNEGS